MRNMARCTIATRSSRLCVPFFVHAARVAPAACRSRARLFAWLVPHWLGPAHGFESDNLVSFRISNFLCDYLILLHFFDVLMWDTYGLMDLLATTA